MRPAMPAMVVAALQREHQTLLRSIVRSRVESASQRLFASGVKDSELRAILREPIGAKRVKGPARPGSVPHRSG